MKFLSVMALFLSTAAFAANSPANDLYSDSLYIERASAEIPASLEASKSAEVAAKSDENPIESVSDLVEESKPKAKKSARK